MQPRKETLRLVALLLLCSSFHVDPTFACSLIDEAASAANSVAVSGHYWIISGLLGGLVIFIELNRRRRWSIISAITLALLIFHPRWTVAPFHFPDCTFQNVEASQFVLAIVCLLLGSQVFRMIRSRRSNS
jgi:uncharacterized membrane protein HdeD (DUF308 family)